jgi:hypothetical protein
VPNRQRKELIGTVIDHELGHDKKGWRPIVKWDGVAFTEAIRSIYLEEIKP